MKTDLVRHALQIGCPVRAARLLLDDSGDARARHRLAQLKRGERSLPLPEGTPESALLAERLGTSMPTLNPLPGAYCLAIYRVGTERVGSVQHLPALAGAPEGADSFRDACRAGELAAVTWLIKRLGLADVSTRHRFSPQTVPPLSTQFLPTDDEGGTSVGLAAALATIIAHTGALRASCIAATGSVRKDGSIEPVEHIVEKLEAVFREAPYITKVLIPGANADAARPVARNGLEVIAVDDVPAALEAVFPDLGASDLAMVEPDRAATRAAQLERDREHGPAAELADAVVSSLADSDLPEPDAALAEIKARVIRGGNRTHGGKAHEALAEFEAIERRLAELDPRVRTSILDIDLRAQIAAFRASAYIDLLQADRAIESCRAVEGDLQHTAAIHQIAVLGSLARSLAAAREFDKAEEASDRQLAVHLLRHDAHHQVQALCNRAEILLRRAESGELGALERAEAVLEDGEAVNRDLPEREARVRNSAFLQLWRYRLHALQGAPDKTETPLPDSTSGAFPDHHLHRFFGDALRRAGRPLEAAEHLRDARNHIADRCGPFERVVLLSAAAVEALALLDANATGWHQPAELFLAELEAWSPGRVRRPQADPSPDSYRDVLETALIFLPY